jgi:hypothetical protein
MIKRIKLLPSFIAGLMLFAAVCPGIEAAGLKLGLRLSGGIAYFHLGDVNDFIRSHAQYRKENGAVMGYPVSGDFESLHYGLDAGVDLLIYLHPRLAISLGSSYIRGRAGKGGQGVTVQQPDLTIHYTNQSGIQAVPVTLGISYFIPLGRSLLFYASAGGSYYWMKWTDDIKDDWLGRGYESESKQTNGHGIGASGALGFEFNVMPAVAFYLEGSGRYVKAGNLKAEEDYSIRDGAYSFDGHYSGKLYYLEFYWPYTDRWYPSQTVQSQKPLDSRYRNVREASIDLSGFAIRAGLRIRF